MSNKHFKEQLNSLQARVLKAKPSLLSATTDDKNKALELICQNLIKNKSKIFEANAVDLKNAKNNNLSKALIDRLLLSENTLNSMVASVQKIIDLDDPVGSITKIRVSPSGFKIGKMRSPLGTIFIIYESRPNVTLDAASLCLKSSNVSILRGGKEAINSNKAIYKAIVSGLTESNLDKNSIVFIDNIDRAYVQELIRADDFIDVIIPRGSKSLIGAIKNNATIPVISHLDGNCHTYVDRYADLDMAEKIIINAKTRRYGVCCALEGLLLDETIATEFLPRICRVFLKKKVEMRVCKKSSTLLSAAHIKHKLATRTDYGEEFLAPIVSIKIVAGVGAAISHINYFGSNHTDVIVSNHLPNCNKFLKEVDSSSVMVNVSSAFADGFEYGLGAEIGISTNKLHVRGPVGLEGLTNEKFILLGSGQTRK